MWTKQGTRALIKIQTRDISTLISSSLKLEEKFTYLGNSVSSTENDINTQQEKAWSAMESLLVIWKPDLPDKMKCNFFQTVVVSVLQYGGTTRMLTRGMEKRLMAQVCYELYWTNAGSNIPQNSSYMINYLPSRKPLKSDEQDMRDADGELKVRF